MKKGKYRVQRVAQRKKRNLLLTEQALCYSSTSLLVSILEYNGFAVHSIECGKPNLNKYSLIVEFAADYEFLNERLNKNLDTYNRLNLKP